MGFQCNNIKEHGEHECTDCAGTGNVEKDPKIRRKRSKEEKMRIYLQTGNVKKDPNVVTFKKECKSCHGWGVGMWYSSKEQLNKMAENNCDILSTIFSEHIKYNKKFPNPSDSKDNGNETEPVAESGAAEPVAENDKTETEENGKADTDKHSASKSADSESGDDSESSDDSKPDEKCDDPE